MKFIPIISLLFSLIFCSSIKAAKSNGIEGPEILPQLKLLPHTLKNLKTHNKLNRSQYPNDDHLKEFKLGKKYCLWGTKNWDDECQDAAMQFVYGKSWKAFKKVALDFIEYTNKSDLDRLIELFNTEDTVFLWDVGFGSPYVPKDPIESIRFMKRMSMPPCKEIIKVDKDTPKIKNEYHLYALTRMSEDWKVAIRGTNYRNFRIDYEPGQGKYATSRMFLSHYLFIDFELLYTDDPKIFAVGYY